LLRFVARRLNESDAEDVVQATLTEAFAAREAPSAPEELRRWVFGIARNKVVDVYRRTKREAPPDSGLNEDAATAESAPLSARDLLRWAENELPNNEGADSTLEWMLREGEGEKLEHIAEEAKLPPARVRQRVSRMRKHYRARWAAQLAAVAALAVLAIAAYAIWRGRATPGPQDIAEEKRTPLDQAHEIRRLALLDCEKEKWAPCIDGLDRAKALDPAGDRAEVVQRAREAAGRALQPKLAPEKAAPETSSDPTRYPRPVETDRPQPKPPARTIPPDSEQSKGTMPAPKPKVAPRKKAASKFEKGFEESIEFGDKGAK
jgi:DNA-directed RNA polymerase specialized sigma24 family protein